MDESISDKISLTDHDHAETTYFSGDQYYNDSNSYGSLASITRGKRKKVYRNKSAIAETDNIHSYNPSINQQQNISFSQYTPDPKFAHIPNHIIKSQSFDGKVTVLSNNDCSDDDRSSNSSFQSATSITSSLESIHTNLTSDSLLHTIEHDNAESSHHPLLGMILVTLSAICYACLNISVKVLMTATPWQELMIIRMFVTWIATMAWIMIQFKGKLTLFGPKKQRFLLVIRAFFLWGAMFTCWWSFEFLPVGDGTTLAMSFPVWVSIIAHFVWYKEDNGSHKLDWFGWICVMLGLAGIVFVAQPTVIFGDDNSETAISNHRDVGVVIGLCSAICAGIQYVIVNYTKRDCHWLQVEQTTAILSTFIFCPLGFIAFGLYDYITGGVFVINWVWLDAWRWVEEIALGLLGFCALALLTRGSQLDAPARTAICLYLEIPVTYIGQCIMTGIFPDVYVWIGIVLVLLSVIVPAARKIIAQSRANNDNENLHKTVSGGVVVDDDDEVNEEKKPLLQKGNDKRDGLNGDGGSTNTNNGMIAVGGVTVDWTTTEEEDNVQDMHTL